MGERCDESQILLMSEVVKSDLQFYSSSVRIVSILERDEPVSVGLLPVPVATVRWHPCDGCCARSVSNFLRLSTAWVRHGCSPPRPSVAAARLWLARLRLDRLRLAAAWKPSNLDGFD
jgi:hypothetical protein